MRTLDRNKQKMLYSLQTGRNTPIYEKDEQGNTKYITVDGKEFGTYSLSQDQVIHIGDTNVCEIKNGKVTMIEATCPDHYCMKQKAVDEHGGSIICLPNKVVIEGENTTEDSDSKSSPKIDAVT